MASRNELSLSIHFRSQPDSGLVLANALELLEPLGLAQPMFRPDWSRRLHPSRAIVERLSRTRRISYWVDGEGVGMRFGPGAGQDFYLELTFRSPPAVSVIDDWSARLTRFDEAIFAYLTDAEWERWENETFLGHYELAKKSSKGRKLIHDPDFDRLCVDISGHAGRRVSRDHYTECLGHQMWLSPAFWATTGADCAQVTSALPSRQLANGVLGIALSAKPFSEKNQPTEHARRLLFP